MDGLENMIYMIDQLLDTKRKRQYYWWNSAECFSVVRWTGSYSNYTHNRRRGGKRL